MTETTFFIEHTKLDSHCRKHFFTSKWTTYSYSKLVMCFEAFSLEIDKKILISIQKETIAEITDKDFFPQTSVKRVIPWKKIELANKPHWLVHSSTGVL